MPEYETQVVIHAPRDFVFSQYADTNNLLKLTNAYKAVRSVKKEGEWEVVEADVAAMGTTGTATVRRRYYPSDKIEEELRSNLATGIQTFIFSDVPEGTKLTMTARIAPKGALGKLLGPLAKGRMKKFSDEQMAIGKRYIEENKPR